MCYTGPPGATLTRPPAPLKSTRGLTVGFTALAVLDLGFVALVLAGVIAGLVQPEGLGALTIVLGVTGATWLLIGLGERVAGTLLMMRHASNLSALGVQGLRLTPMAWLALWLPLPLRLTWVVPYLYADVPWVHAIWLLPTVVVVGCGALLHELWRATEPDQHDHWRYVPLAAPVISWTFASLLDVVIPLVQPFGLIATIVLLRRVENRMVDKAIVSQALWSADPTDSTSSEATPASGAA